MPHIQVKTSPDKTGDNLRRVVNVLAGLEVAINIDGIGPDFEAPHIRTVVDDEQVGAAIDALTTAGMPAVACKALYIKLENVPGQLRGVLNDLAKRGYVVESILILAGRDDGDPRVRVSIGIGGGVPNTWEDDQRALADELGVSPER
jgi:hypothetical protein